MDHVKMTESFAGAMVTVIPIIMLIAGTEYKKYAQKQIAALDRQLQDAGALASGADESETDTSPGEVGPMLKSGAWAVLAMTHVLAEVKLIVWLASSEQEPEPGWATYIAYTGIFGFAITVLLPMFIDQSELLQKRRLLSTASSPADMAVREFSRRQAEVRDARNAAADEETRPTNPTTLNAQQFRLRYPPLEHGASDASEESST
ncbi:hypothetical protein [Streptomyces sp. enrichment culture]|uniref:hypothetical protein n=1 Tax=Streptomyces sp. enrichment culture TaxID=1795815 RepID=UPI003F54BB88